MKCDPGSGWKLSKGKYDQGNGLIDYGSHVIFKVGNTKTEFFNQPLTFEDKVHNTDVTFRGSYYIINHLALGGELSFYNSGREADDNSFKSTSTEFHFYPEAMYNMPVDNAWRNLFVKGGGYFGSTNSEIKSGNNSVTTKESFTGYNFGLGYYAFFADETALKICAYHRSITYKDKETDDKTRYKGFAAEIGIVHHFYP